MLTLLAVVGLFCCPEVGRFSTLCPLFLPININYISQQCYDDTLYNKVLNLASDPKGHFNLGLHIIQNQ